MRLYRTKKGNLLENQDKFWLFDKGWDELINRNDLYGFLANAVSRNKEVSAMEAAVLMEQDLLAPIGSQEVWAAGVTYLRSRDARMEESRESGGASFYDKVYAAERPELFFKSTASRTVGTGSKVKIRADAHWSVPEPELTLVVSPAGRIVGYTIGNDMSSRDIEGENPLYLPQAKVYSGSCALGPGILVTPSPLAHSTEIAIEILRHDRVEFAGSVELTELKRDPKTLVEYLLRDNSFPFGVFLMTGTGIVPPSTFTLASGDRIRITIEPIGTLENEVA